MACSTGWPRHVRAVMCPLIQLWPGLAHFAWGAEAEERVCCKIAPSLTEHWLLVADLW